MKLSDLFLLEFDQESTCFRDVAKVGWKGGWPPGGLKSSESCSMVGTAQPASSAICPAMHSLTGRTEIAILAI